MVSASKNNNPAYNGIQKRLEIRIILILKAFMFLERIWKEEQITVISSFVFILMKTTFQESVSELCSMKLA